MNWLSKFGLSKPTRLELLAVLLLAFLIPVFYAGKQSGVLGTSTVVPNGGGATPTPPPPSPATCTNGLIEKFSLYSNCGGSNYRTSDYVCKGGKHFVEGGTSSCKPVSLWYQYAQQNCAGYCQKPTPTKSNPTPTPPQSSFYLKQGVINKYSAPKIGVVLSWSQALTQTKYTVYQRNSKDQGYISLFSTSALSYEAIVNGSLSNYFMVQACGRTSPSGPSLCKNSNDVYVAAQYSPTPTPYITREPTPTPSPTP